MKINTKLKGRNIKCEHVDCECYMQFSKCNKSDAHHHLFSNDTRKGGNRDTYGDLIDEDFNIIFINNDCHITKVIPKLTELEFRQKAEELGYKLPPPSKSFQFRGL